MKVKTREKGGPKMDVTTPKQYQPPGQTIGSFRGLYTASIFLADFRSTNLSLAAHAKKINCLANYLRMPGSVGDVLLSKTERPYFGGNRLFRSPISSYVSTTLAAKAEI